MRGLIPNFVFGTLVVAAGLPRVAWAQAGRVLAYQLDTGDRVVFESQSVTVASEPAGPAELVNQRSTSNNGQVLARTTAEVQIWCLARDGPELLVLAQLSRGLGGAMQPVGGAVFYVDRAGQRRVPPETMTRLDGLDLIFDVLPVLPAGAQSDAEWLTVPDWLDREWRCANRGADASQGGALRIEFAVEDRTGALAAQNRAQTGTFWFDIRAGLPVRLQQRAGEAGVRERTDTIAALRDRVPQSVEWCARRAEEARRWLRTCEQEDGLLRELITRPGEVAQTLAQMDRSWAAFKSDCDARALSPFVGLAEARRQWLRAEAGRLEGRAALAQRWMDHKAVKWTLQDARGQTVICEQARAGVVVEYYWSSAVPASLAALGPFRRMAAELPRPPVGVLSFNLDEDYPQAVRAASACAEGLQTLVAGPLAQGDPMSELPVVRVVDARGIVRGLWIGWQPSYTGARALALEAAGVGR